MSFEVLMGILCGLLFLAALFFLFYAMSSFWYPQSQTTVEVYPTAVRPPRRWWPIFVQSGISLVTAGVGTGLFSVVFMPDISAKARAEQLADAEEITRLTFKEKLGQEPDRLTFEEEDPRNGFQQILKLGWELKGTAWFNNNEAWDVTVKKGGIELKCEAKRRP